MWRFRWVACGCLLIRCQPHFSPKFFSFPCVCPRESPTCGAESVVVFAVCESLGPADVPHWLWEGKASVLGDICCTRRRNHRQTGGSGLAGSCARIYQRFQNRSPPHLWFLSDPNLCASIWIQELQEELTVHTRWGQDVPFTGLDPVYFKF